MTGGSERVSDGSAPALRRDRQPYLHDLVTVVATPALALSPADGQIAGGADGCYLADRRLLSRLVVTVDGAGPAPVRGQSTGAASARFVGVARGLGDPGPDPTVLVERDRAVSAAGVRETVTLRSRARLRLSCTVAVEMASDLAHIAQVKAGRPTAALLPLPGSGAAAGRTGPSPGGPASTVRWRAADGATVLARLSPPPGTRTGGRAEWTVTLAPRQSWTVTLDVTLDAGGLDAGRDRGPDSSPDAGPDGGGADGRPAPGITAAANRPAWEPPRLTAGDHRLPALLARSVADLDGLLAADSADPRDHFLTAGAPWYLTLFGRDSLWAARMALPLGTGLAAGTLRTLARRQGRRVDLATAEEPGRILHEVRLDDGGPTGAGAYYGTVDATPLWISLLHDAWRWGLPAADVAALLPRLEAALGWLGDFALDESGFVRYADRSGRGLANQGWKDSFDSVQFADGTLAGPPIALCEVQAYAYAAALHGADLLDAFGRPGGAGWRAWAAALAGRVRDRFWVEDPGGRYPAIALDGSGRQVDTVTSNIGHLLGLGLLDPEETECVVRRLAAPDLDCGFGLRTMSSLAAGFNPLSYHGGSVWAHDTAIAIRGLAGIGTGSGRAAAASLISGLLAAAPAFDFRLPELYGGESAGDGRLPLAYPAACRPQAWSAAAAVQLVSAILGLEPDVPAGRLRLRPLRPSPVGELTVHGLRVAGERLDLRLTAYGDVEVLAAPGRLRLDLP